jgi:hypothetical protein
MATVPKQSQMAVLPRCERRPASEVRAGLKVGYDR